METSQPSFAAFLHNPFGYPSKIQQAAIMSFKRMDRFGGPNIDTLLDETILKYFGNSKVLHTNGLIKQYQELKNYVIEQKLVGLIIYGADLSQDDINYINYPTQDNKTIPLTRHSICVRFLKEHMTNNNEKLDEILDKYCRETPNFDIYYKPNDS